MLVVIRSDLEDRAVQSEVVYFLFQEKFFQSQDAHVYPIPQRFQPEAFPAKNIKATNLEN